MALVELIHNSAYAAHIRESQFIYPLLQCAHIIGLSMFAGGVGLSNARVSGVGAGVGLVDFASHAMRIAWIGFAIVLVTGINMAASFLEVFAVSTVMQAKLCVIALVLVNAAVIQRGIAGADRSPWAVSPPDPAAARKWAAAGVAALLVVITLGKLLAYIGGKD